MTHGGRRSHAALNAAVASSRVARSPGQADIAARACDRDSLHISNCNIVKVSTS